VFKSGEDAEASQDFIDVLKKSGENYLEAAKWSPVDEESRYGTWDVDCMALSNFTSLRPVYLRSAMSGYCRSGSSLSFILPILGDYVSGIPKTKAIWELSAASTNEGMQSDQNLWVEWHGFIKGQLKDGLVEESDAVRPEWEQNIEYL
jgi:hypothetical protein